MRRLLLFSPLLPDGDSLKRSPRSRNARVICHLPQFSRLRRPYRHIAWHAIRTPERGRVRYALMIIQPLTLSVGGLQNKHGGPAL